MIYKDLEDGRRKAGSLAQEHAVSLSIVVPCYRAERYLSTCLDSLMAQTLQSIEVICINDGSPDRSLDIMNEYQARYGNKLIIIDKENEGVWQARLDGINRARGSYIGFVDSDDYVEPTYAERLYRAAVSNNADIAVCGFERTDLETGKVLSRELCAPKSPFFIDEDEGRIIEINTALWNKCFRAELVKRMRTLEKPIEVLEDVMFHLLAYLDSHASIVFVPQPLVHYMVHPESAINSMHKEQVDEILSAFLEVKRAYCEFRPSMLEALDAIAFLHLGVSLLFRMSSDPRQNTQQLIRCITDYLDKHFSSWRSSPYFTLSYARSHGASYKRLLVAQTTYRLHAMQALLTCYRFVTKALQIDIKW